MTDEQRAAYIASLIEERHGYLEKGKKDRADAVDQELRRLGAEAKPAAVTAAKRADG